MTRLEQRRQIFNSVMADSSPPAAGAAALKPGSSLSFEQTLDLHPLPGAVADMDGLHGLQYVKGKDKVLLVRALVQAGCCQQRPPSSAAAATATAPRRSHQPSPSPSRKIKAATPRRRRRPRVAPHTAQRAHHAARNSRARRFTASGLTGLLDRKFRGRTMTG